MIIPDINLLLYAYDASSPFHSRAAAWWRGCLSGDEPVGMLPVIIFGFVRIGTHVRAFKHPMSPAEAAGHVRSWLEQEAVELLEPGPEHVDRVLKLLEGLGTAGDLVTDAQIAAAAADYGAVVHTTDADFLRFRDLRWFNPITGVSHSGQRKPRGT